MNKINLKLLDFIKLNKRNELYKTIFYLWKNKVKITIQNIVQHSKLSLKNITNEVDKNNGLKEIK
ncbi:hypothetical protein [Spiroplasma endosymbiont of Labia minor]|uniref:hypothetical protein n=1 Tax=Spiroplasma endosymbiont of Labia minor TaxID=3066305 RepID=UPI0030CD1628